jgi:hypothetical protein
VSEGVRGVDDGWGWDLGMGEAYGGHEQPEGAAECESHHAGDGGLAGAGFHEGLHLGGVSWVVWGAVVLLLQ